MLIYPAIDLFEGQAVRLFKGDYSNMTVYSSDPPEVARSFSRAGADHIHLVDLEGAKSGVPANAPVIRRIIETFGGFAQVGGGVRSMQTIDTYLRAGASRVILGTAAVEDPAFLEEALQKYGERIAVGVDLKDGHVAVRGWTRSSALTADAFFARMQALGVRCIICTDISRDGAMKGTNRELYRTLSARHPIDLIASGGVSGMDDIRALRAMNLHGAIIGKAWYIGAIDLREAVEVAK